MKNEGKRFASALIIAAGAVLAVAVADTHATGMARHEERPRTATLISCRKPTPGWEAIREYTIEVSNATSAPYTMERDSNSIPVGLVDSAVYFLSDSTLCHRAAHAHAREVGDDTINPDSVFLLRAGPTRYITGSSAHLGKYYIRVIFDTAFVKLSAIGS